MSEANREDIVLIVGGTGSQLGGTPEQLASAERLFLRLRQMGATEYHHGQCVGWDDQTNTLARSARLRTIAHPGDTPDKRAPCLCDDYFGVLGNLDRDRVIARLCSILVAGPRGPERRRSGTWATVRYARHQHKPVVLILPDGTMQGQINGYLPSDQERQRELLAQLLEGEG